MPRRRSATRAHAGLPFFLLVILILLERVTPDAIPSTAINTAWEHDGGGDRVDSDAGLTTDTNNRRGNEVQAKERSGAGLQPPPMRHLKLVLDGIAREAIYQSPTEHASGSTVRALLRVAEGIATNFSLDSGMGCVNNRGCVVDKLWEHLWVHEKNITRSSNAERSRDSSILGELGWQWTSANTKLINDLLKINSWHFAMLNDHDRNWKYDLALRRAIGQLRAERIDQSGRDVRVIDLGAGSGLLSMMAARAEASDVFAIEQSEITSRLALTVLSQNGFGPGDEAGASGEAVAGGAGESPSSPSGGKGRIHWIPKSSRDVTLSDIGGQRAHILVSETLGPDGVFTEQSIMLVPDVRKRLMVPGAIVIPHRVAMHAAIIRCDSLVQLTRVSTAAGFDVSSMNRARAELGSTHLRRTSTGWGISLQDVPHDVVAGPFPVIDVDLDEMDQSMFGWGCAENTGLKTRVTSFLPVRSAGEIHAVVLWFEAHLLGGRQMGEGNERGGTDNVISTSPWAWDASFARGHHWESVIQVFDVDRSGKAMHVRLGDRLRLTASLNVSAQYGNGEIHFVDVEAERGTI